MWVEISYIDNATINRTVTPFGECGLKLSACRICQAAGSVTPFGECGLKFSRSTVLSGTPSRHSLWGVWVEIRRNTDIHCPVNSHSLWGVWVEINLPLSCLLWNRYVTPFGECGLKYGFDGYCTVVICHSLWGVWVEILDTSPLLYNSYPSLPLGSVG